MEHRGRFTAHDEFGNEYGINIYVKVIDVKTHDNPHGTIDGLKRLITDEGAVVNRLGKGRYQIVHAGIEVSSDDPNAP